MPEYAYNDEITTLPGHLTNFFQQSKLNLTGYGKFQNKVFQVTFPSYCGNKAFNASKLSP